MTDTMADEQPWPDAPPARPLVFNREIKSPGWGYLHARCTHGTSVSELYVWDRPPPNQLLDEQQIALTNFHKLKFPACDCKPVGPPTTGQLPA